MSEVEQQFDWPGFPEQVTETDRPFLNFLSIVQQAAAEQGKLFYFWSHEGNDIFTDELDGGDMSGWLVPPERAEEFEAAWKVSDQLIPDDLYDGFTIARWSGSPETGIEITFT